MFQKFELQAVNINIDPKIEAYARKKIGGLDKYLDRHSRPSAHCEVHLKELKVKSTDRYSCEVTLYLPKQTIVLKERSLNFYAAIDIAEAKLKTQLNKYKDGHSPKKRRHLLGRFKNR